MVTSYPGNGASALSVRSLINSKRLSKAARAVLGAEILAGEYDLQPTDKLVAAAVGCSVAYLQAAKKLTPSQRQDVRKGLRPLIVPRIPAVPPSARQRMAALVDELGFMTVESLLNELYAPAPFENAA
jgi:hypothetical protein